MDIKYTYKYRFVIVHLNEEIDLYNSNEFKKEMNDLIEKTPLNICMDMASIQSANSTMIVALLSVMKRMKVLGREFALMNVRDEVISILQLANLLSHFRLYKDDVEFVEDNEFVLVK